MVIDMSSLTNEANSLSSPKKTMTDSLVHIGLALAFVAHLFVAVGYWWVSPKGFPVEHPRFWLNTVLPWGVVIVVGLGLVGLMRDRLHVAGQVVLLLGCAWLGGSLAAWFFFPISLRGIWGLGLVVAAIEFGFAFWLLRREFRVNAKGIACGLVSLLVGVFPVYAQVPLPASTQPVNEMAPALQDAEPVVLRSPIELGEGVSFNSHSVEIVLRREQVDFFCHLMLEFDRISPDRFWSLLAPRPKASPKLVSAVVGPTGEHSLKYSNNSTVSVSPMNDRGVVECTVWTKLEQETYTHLNTSCRLYISGDEDLRLSFSPCPDVHLEVLPADYPTGRPARFAYLNEQGEFRVVEATTGEKGPFHLLAAGHLGRDEPLSISFYDNGKLLTTFTLDDWSRQLSTDISPTAGWGVPVNAIEFQRTGKTKDSPINIFFTLAATAVGRGWESVGHRAGVYRNRVSFQLEPNAVSEAAPGNVVN